MEFPHGAFVHKRGVPLVDSKSDIVCVKHGGQGEPPKWNREEIIQYRLDQASNLFLDAEDYWKSMNPKVRRKGRQNYRQLLEKYADLEVVLKNLQRIKERADATIED